ncbi:uncharacterized protein LOC114351941 [Ostrinia furnacalis]|uniref:uncharacterized protein LOC114351941 n=1 Tax=Ostrinia furnacalis TaxID=93504 RepID=UPI001038CC04|nr:uncharacterized protein LOC114351941 [Ostrinia furnacalis]
MPSCCPLQKEEAETRMQHLLHTLHAHVRCSVSAEHDHHGARYHHRLLVCVCRRAQGLDQLRKEASTNGTSKVSLNSGGVTGPQIIMKLFLTYAIQLMKWH